MSIIIKFDEKKMETVQNILSGIKGGAERAMSRAINRTVTYGKTQSSRLIRKEYTITPDAVRRATTAEGTGKTGRLLGRISFKGRPKQLRNFARRVGNHGSVQVSVKRGTGLRLIPGAFMRRINSGPAIMRRIWTTRYPLEVLHGPSVPQMAGGETVRPQLEKDIGRKLDERVEHEMNVLIRGITK